MAAHAAAAGGASAATIRRSAFAKLGVDVFLGDARFSGADTLAVGDRVLRFKRAVIATGSRAGDLERFPAWNKPAT